MNDAVPPLHEPYVDLVPPEGLRLTPRHYAYLKISEGCNNRCSFCIIPSLRGDLAQPASGARDGGSRAAREGRREGDAGHQPGHLGLRARHQVRGERLEGGAAEGAVPRSDACDRQARCVGAAALRLSLSACRRRHSADGGGQDPALSRHPVPARLAVRAEGDAAPGPSGEDARAHRPLARDLPGPCYPLDLHRRLSGRDGGGLRVPARLAEGSKINRAGCFKYEPVEGATANELEGACRTR